MIPITDEEAVNWPLDETNCPCFECEKRTSTVCGYCGTQLCEELDCIKAHAARGCYTNVQRQKQGSSYLEQVEGSRQNAIDLFRHAEQPPTPINPHPQADAGSQYNSQDAKQEPVLDA